MLQILILGFQDIPHQGLLNKNNILSQAFTLNIEVTFTFLITAPSLCLNIIYKRLTLVAIHFINLLVTVSNLYLILALYLISTTYKGEAITNILQKPLCHSTDLIYHCALFYVISYCWLAYDQCLGSQPCLLPFYTFFSSLYHNVVIQSTLLQYCDSLWYL